MEDHYAVAFVLRTIGLGVKLSEGVEEVYHMNEGVLYRSLEIIEASFLSTRQVFD